MIEKISVIILWFFLSHRSAAEEFFNTTPYPIKSNFSCVGRSTGYYADLPSKCRVYHNCDDQGNKFSYYCPEMTLFRQEALICDHAHLVDCETGSTQVRKITHQDSNNLGKLSTQDVGRWTTVNPYLESLFFKKNSTTDRDAVKQGPAAGLNFFSVRFGNSSETNSGFRNNQKWKKNEEQLSGSKGTDFGNDNNETRFGNGHFFGGKSKSKETLSNVQSSTSPSSYFGLGQTTQTTKSYFNFRNNDYRWSDNKADGRRSTQNPVTKSFLKTTATIFTSTTEIPFRDFTASLKPLVPNTPEYDPYYPRESSTEAYYTPSEKYTLPRALEAPNFEPSRFGVYFKIPDVWPDFNTIDDIVDRRKLFFIPSKDEIF